MRAAALACAALCACANPTTAYTALAPEQRAVVRRELSRSEETRYLRLSFYVTRFFGEAEPAPGATKPRKRLLSAIPPSEVKIADGAATLSLGTPSEKILPAGTPVHVRKVEFPTAVNTSAWIPQAWIQDPRDPNTPRFSPWVLLRVDGDETDYVLVLPAEIDSPSRFFSELDRYLSSHDPRPVLDAMAPRAQLAVETKTLFADIPAEAAEMALGYPEKKKLHFEGGARCEEWVYGSGRRVAIVNAGRLIGEAYRGSMAAAQVAGTDPVPLATCLGLLGNRCQEDSQCAAPMRCLPGNEDTKKECRIACANDGECPISLRCLDEGCADPERR